MFLNQIKAYSKMYSACQLIIFIIFSAVSTFAKPPKQNSCSGVYFQLPVSLSQVSNSISPKKSPRIRTENLLNYLSLVFNQQQVSLEALTNMLRSLEQGQLINPVTEKEALNSSIMKVIRNGIQSSISRNDLDIERILQGLRIIVKEEARQEERRGEAHEKTTLLVHRANFQDIRPGKFMMGETSEDKAKIETEITIPFAMMDTQVTQYMWTSLKIVMGERTDLDKINPSYFKTGPESVTMNIDGIEVQMKTNHPVESVSWTEVNEFIDRLNQLSSHGDLKTQELLQKIIPGHQKGDVYDLPTEAQWEFVMRDRGNANKKYFDRDDDTEFPNYAWTVFNSGNLTHAVSTRHSRIIDGKSFYDLEGNVWEWVKDSTDGKNELPGGKDPIVNKGSYRVMRGGSVTNIWGSLSELSAKNRPHEIGKAVGFRLVRTRP